MSLETSGLARSMEILQNTWAMSGTEVMINDFFFHKAKKKKIIIGTVLYQLMLSHKNISVNFFRGVLNNVLRSYFSST